MCDGLRSHQQGRSHRRDYHRFGKPLHLQVQGLVRITPDLLHVSIEACRLIIYILPHQLEIVVI